jgi:hypothetical protein
METYINVYRLLETRIIEKHKTHIPEALFGLSQSDERKWLDISPMSGCISFAHYGELWQEAEDSPVAKPYLPLVDEICNQTDDDFTLSVGKISIQNDMLMSWVMERILLRTMLIGKFELLLKCIG